jgi:signal peptidase II
MPSRMDRRFASLVVAAAVVLLDRLTKGLIKAHFSLYDSWTVIPGIFNIVHTENPGIAFGLLADASNYWLRSVVLIGFSVTVLIAVSAVLLRPASVAALGGLLRAGLSLVMGGAAGNLYDRIVNGTVTDFVEIHAGPYYFPAFNVADSAITIGACLLLLDMWRSRERKSQTADI